MKIAPFKLERYFAKYEFSAPYLLSCSDCEPLSMKELLSMADKENLMRWENLGLGYTESQGNPMLKNEISDLYSSVTPEDILILTPEEGIFIAMNVLLEPEDHVITMYPGYQSLYEIAKSMQCNVSKWYPKKDNSFDINDLIQQITPKTKLIVINFPHNPTGAVITQKELERVIAVAAENDIRIFSDEMYRHLEYSPDIRLPSVSDVYHQGISLFGMSKTFGLPGLRIGWITAKDKKLFQEMCQFKDYTTICSSAPSEMLALIALKNKERIIARNLEIIKNNLLILEEFFEKYKKLFRWRRPLAGPIAFPEVLTDQPIQAFCQDLVKKKGIMLLPAAVYDYPGQNVRFGYGRKNIPEILTILEDYIQEEKL